MFKKFFSITNQKKSILSVFNNNSMDMDMDNHLFALSLKIYFPDSKHHYLDHMNVFSSKLFLSTI